MKVKKIIRSAIPRPLLGGYHYSLAFLGALLCGFPSKKLTVIGVTGTSGKSTTVDFITRILEENGDKVASMSTVRFKIGGKEWKNKLKMTMPGRFKVQQFLKQAADQGSKYAVIEVTSEGIAQFRHKFINFDTAVFTNLSPEHIESHGSFENYRNQKLKLFRVAKSHVLNMDDKNVEHFLKIPAKGRLGFFIPVANPPPFIHEYPMSHLFAEDLRIGPGGISFKVQDTEFNLKLLGTFNAYNALAALAVAAMYNIPWSVCKKALEKVGAIPGRMEVVSRNPLVVVDYAHTPEQLELAYRSLEGRPLICVLGSCGGGRDKWKRPVLGEIARKHCKDIIITNEDPYDEDPMQIISQVAEKAGEKAMKILDREEAIKKAVGLASPGDAIIITGKGAEPLMCIKDGKKIPWDDREIARKALVKTPT